jgi:hypothetical protein
MIPLELAEQLLDLYQVWGLRVTEVRLNPRQGTLPVALGHRLEGVRLLYDPQVVMEALEVRHEPVTSILETLGRNQPLGLHGHQTLPVVAWWPTPEYTTRFLEVTEAPPEAIAEGLTRVFPQILLPIPAPPLRQSAHRAEVEAPEVTEADSGGPSWTALSDQL